MHMTDTFIYQNSNIDLFRSFQSPFHFPHPSCLLYNCANVCKYIRWHAYYACCSWTLYLKAEVWRAIIIRWMPCIIRFESCFFYPFPLHVLPCHSSYQTIFIWLLISHKCKGRWVFSNRAVVNQCHYYTLSNWIVKIISYIWMVVVSYEHRTLNTIHMIPKWKSFTWTQSNGFTISFRLKIRYMVDYFVSYESFAATVLWCMLYDSRLNDVVVYFRSLFFLILIVCWSLLFFLFNPFEVFNICNDAISWKSTR